MVDISGKKPVNRIAVAVGRIYLREGTLEAIRDKGIRKGDPLVVAEIAGMNAAKRTPELLPHCHQIPIDKIDLSFQMDKDHIETTCTVKSVAKTGVEMEALVGVTNALNTIWDMVKYLEKKDGQYPETRIGGIRVIKKTKGGTDG